MNQKIFLIDPSIKNVNKKDLLIIEEKKEKYKSDSYKEKREKSKRVLKERDALIHVYGRVIIKVDKESKNEHTFENGITIRRERQFNELNRRLTEPVNAIVISGENIPTDCEILIQHNSLHDSNRIFNYKNASETSDICYYSIPETDCFAWRDKDGIMKPMKNFDFALRVFEPHSGVIEGIPPTLIKDTLYVTTGELSGKVVMTLKACDYQIIYQDTNGREAQLIRFRPVGDEEHNLEPEAICILHDLTKQVINGSLLVGIDVDNSNLLK